MGGVAVWRGSDSKYLVQWGRPYPKDCCGVPQTESALAIAAIGVSKVD